MTITNTLVPRTADALLGSEIAQVTGNDVDSGPVLWYALSPSGPQDPFSVGRYGGRLSLTGPLDFEQRDRYHLQLLAHDGPHEGRANLTVLVDDVNDNAPAFSQTLYQVPVLPPLGPGLFMMEGSDKARRSWGGLYVGTDLGTELGGYKGPISNQPSKSSELCPGSAFRAQKWGKEGNSIRGIRAPSWNGCHAELMGPSCRTQAE